MMHGSSIGTRRYMKVGLWIRDLPESADRIASPVARIELFL